MNLIEERSPDRWQPAGFRSRSRDSLRSMPQGRARLLIARFGALCYSVWALAHLMQAWLLYDMGYALSEPLLAGRLQQTGWTLGFIATLSLVIALRLNWHGSRRGYWANLILVCNTELGFVAFLLIPGASHAFLSPILACTAVIATTISYPKQEWGE